MLIHIKIYGRVQGVGFRSFVQKKATDLNLSGWVRNRIAGTVEVLADGSEKSIVAFLEFCKRGPLFARVDRIEAISIPDAPVSPIQYGLFETMATV